MVIVGMDMGRLMDRPKIDKFSYEIGADVEVPVAYVAMLRMFETFLRGEMSEYKALSKKITGDENRLCSEVIDQFFKDMIDSIREPMKRAEFLIKEKDIHDLSEGYKTELKKRHIDFLESIKKLEEMYNTERGEN